MAVELVNDGELTSDGRELKTWLAQKIEDYDANVEKKGKPPLTMDWLTTYMNAIRSAVTPVEFFTKYPYLTAELWGRYATALPDDDPRKALPAADSEETARQARAARNAKANEIGDLYRRGNQAAVKAQALNRLAQAGETGEEAMKLNQGDLLTVEGQKVVALLERYLPDNDAGRAYMEFVHRQQWYTPARFFREFPDRAASLQTWYKTEGQQVMAQKALEQVAALRNTVEALDEMRGAGKNARQDTDDAEEIAALRAGLKELAEAITGGQGDTGAQQAAGGKTLAETLGNRNLPFIGGR